MFDWFFHCEKKFEGKWKGKGFIISKVCEKKIMKKMILTKLFIKKIDNFSYKVYIRNKIDNEYTNVELIGFINRETNVLEFQNSSGISQFYFDNKYLINSFNTNKNKCISTGTIKLVPDIKHCSSSSSNSSCSSCSSGSYGSSSSSSSSSSSKCKKKCHKKCNKKCHKKCNKND